MGFNRLLALGCIISGLVLGACGSAKKTTATSKGNSGRQVACPVKSKDQPHLSWYVEKTELLDSFRAKPSMAAGAKVYSLDTNEAKSFFALFRDSVGMNTTVVMSLPLPPPNECKTFDVSVSKVMNAKLRQKYPDMIALQGKATDGKGDARINYDGHKVKIQVNMNGQVTLINAIRYHGQTYYIAYSRASSPDKKEPFEETGDPRNENKK